MQIKGHVSLPFTDQLKETDMTFRQSLISDKTWEAINIAPDDWLNWTGEQEVSQDLRGTYIQSLEERVGHSELFVNET